MVEVTPIRTVELSYRAYFVSGADGLVAAASKDGLISVAGGAAGVVAELQLDELRGLTMIDSRRVLLRCENWLELRRPLSGERVRRLTGCFAAAEMLASGQLWTVAVDDASRARLECRDAETWEVSAAVDVEDPFGASRYWISPHPSGLAVAVWVAAGQDGQCNFLAEVEGARLTLRRLDIADSTGPPVFSGDGSTYLVEDFCVLRLRETLTGRVLKQREWEVEDDAISMLAVTGEPEVLVLGWDSGDVLLVDTATLGTVGFVTLRGEPESWGYLYSVGGPRIVSVITRSLQPVQRDALVFWHVP